MTQPGSLVRLFLIMLLALTLSSLAAASIVTSINDQLTSSDPTQVGRLFRSGVASDWSTVKAYPGVSGASTLHYKTYSFVASAFTDAPFVQISIDDPSSAIFVSTYLTSYDPNHKDVNYFGDAGSSGNPFGMPGFFQVDVPAGFDLVILVNEVSSGVDGPYNLLVEQFADTMYTDPVPEPASLLLMGSGLVAVAKRLRRAR